MPKTNVVMLRIRANATILDLMLKIATEEYDGNLSSYVRSLLYSDLLNRQIIDELTIKILEGE